MPMAGKTSNYLPNLATDSLADYTLGFTCAPLLMKTPLNTDLTIRPDQLFWRRASNPLSNKKISFNTPTSLPHNFRL